MLLNPDVVKGIVFRHLYVFKHNFERIADAFYWPAMDILLWGFTSVYFTKQSSNAPGLVLALLSGLILWIVVWRGQYEITVNLLEEMWNTNMVNLFGSPLRVREWIVGVFILGFLKLLLSVSFAILISLIIYQANIFSLGLWLVPFAASLLITGWSVGLIVAGLIIYYGIKIQTFAWGGIFLIAPFSGIYYPISTLPIWAQQVAQFLPTSYVFEGMRSIIFAGSFSATHLIISFLLNALFLIIGILFFNFMFTKSKEKGLARLE